MDGKPIVTTEYRLSASDPVVLSRRDCVSASSEVIEVFGEASDEDSRVVGRVHAYLMPPDIAVDLESSSHLDPLELLTTEEGVLDDELLSASGLGSSASTGGDLLIVDRLELLPDAQGFGLGGDLLRDLFRVAARDASLVALRAYPLQFERSLEGYRMPSPWGPEWTVSMNAGTRTETFAEAVRAVEGFYSRVGFVVAARDSCGTAIMLRGLPVEKSTSELEMAG